MSDQDREFDLASALQVAVFTADVNGQFQLHGRLPHWWSHSIGDCCGDRMRFKSPFIHDFLIDAEAFWNSSSEPALHSALCEMDDNQQVILQAIAKRAGQKRLLILRNLQTDDAWLSDVLSTARTKMLNHERDRRTHKKEVADVVADRDKAREQEQLQSRVLANLSHEIRTPLTTILGLLNLAEGASVDQQVNEYLVGIGSAAHQMLNLGNDILDLSKMQAERVVLDSQLFSLTEFTRDLKLEWSVQAARHDLQFHLEIESSVPDDVVGDSFRLRQILSNLLGNAMKFTEQGSVTLVLDCNPVNTPYIRFTVEDTGLGIPAEVLPRIFDAYTQVDPDQGKRHEGAGLGLAIAGKLAKLMGPGIHVESQLNEGTRFWFDAKLCRQTGMSQQTNSSESTAASLAGLRILVAEDHALNRSILVSMLEAAGGQVTDVADGRNAVIAVGNCDFDVILMDCQMPILDGLAAVQEIRAFKGPEDRVPILVLTAHATQRDQKRILSQGADRYLKKPFNEEQLIRTIVEMTSNTKPKSDR